MVRDLYSKNYKRWLKEIKYNLNKIESYLMLINWKTILRWQNYKKWFFNEIPIKIPTCSM